MGSRLMRMGGYGLGVLIAMFSVGAHVMAQTAPVPEIDGASIVSGLGLLSAAVLILKSRWK